MSGGPFDDLIPGNKRAPGGFIYTPPTDSIGQQQKAATLAGTIQRNAVAAQKAPYELQSAKATAAKAAIDLKNAQDEDQTAYGDPNLTGQARLASVPPDKRGIVSLLINNKLSNLSTFALKSPQIQAYLNTAMAVDPTFDPSLMAPRTQALKDFTGAGKASQAVGAVNRLAANLQQLKAISDEMGGPNLGNSTVNHVVAGVEQDFEPKLRASYDALLPEIANQFDLIMKSNKGSPTVSGIAEAMNGLRRAQSEDERNAAFAQVGAAIHGAIAPLKDEWDAAYGGTKAPPMWISGDAAKFFSSLDPEHAADYGGNDWRGLPGLKGDGTPGQAVGIGGNPPPGGGPGGGSSGAPVLGGGGASGVTRPDYSTMAGNPNSATLATMDPNSKLGVFKQTYRAEYDPETAAGLNALIHKGSSLQEAQAYVASRGADPIDPAQYAAAVTYAGQPGHQNVNLVNATKTVPTTLGERLASSPAAAAVMGATAGGTAGLSDLAGHLIGGDAFDANRAALAGTHGTADLIGNLGGGIVTGAFGAPILKSLSPAAADALATVGTRLGKFATPLGDAAYGGLYGADENPQNPIRGGLAGALMGAGTGGVTRKVVGGMANALSPPAGNFGPLYEAGVFPTIGQRFGKSGVAGRAANTIEQAMQSVPALGAAPAAARQATRDAFQVGAFNNSLGQLKPFGESVATALPSGTGPGTDAHAFANQQFGNAYDIARQGMRFVPDAQYFRDASTLANQVNSGVLAPNQVQQLNDVVNNAVAGRLKAQGGALDGNAYQAASSDLGRAIQTWGKNPNTAAMADALSDYQTIFDNAARRVSDPAAVNLLDAADRGYAQLVRIQRASELGGAAKDAGTFTPNNYAAAVKQMGGGVRSSAYNQGNALGQDYAQAGLNLSDRLADSGTPVRLGVLGALQGAEGVALGVTGKLAALANPGALAAFAPYAPGLRNVTNRLIAPNAQRVAPLSPDIAAALDGTADKLNLIAPYAGRATIPGALAYYGIGQ